MWALKPGQGPPIWDTMRAILYSRWSSLEQNGTTSAPRQAEATDAFARRQGWAVVERLSDEGQSAWTGANITTGQLGSLITRLEPDHGQGLVLVVERLDRLSRQAPLIMAGWVQRACATGLTIATADGAHIIDRERLERDQMTVLAMIFESFRGYSESQAKSERVADAWERKRRRGAAMTRRCPAWLSIPQGATSYRSPMNGVHGFVPIADRAAIVERIFQMAAQGIGAATIAAQLNREGVEPWAGGKGWYASYVRKITRNPAVIGEFQPHTKPRGGKRMPAGVPIPDYFPAVVSVELFERVNDVRRMRVVAEQSANRLVNLFGGLAHCGRCGGTMSYVGKGYDILANGQKVPRRYLRCSSNHRSAGCDNRNSYSYDVVEDAVLTKLLHLAMDPQVFTEGSGVSALEAKLSDAKRRLTQAERQQNFAFGLLEEDPDDILAATRYRERKTEAKQARDAVKQIADELTNLQRAVSPEEHIANIREVRSLLVSEDEGLRYQARSRVKLALNDLIASIVFEGRRKRFAVRLVDGVRVLAFGDLGSCGLDVDWIELGYKPDAMNARVVADYVTRREAVEDHSRLPLRPT